MEFKQTWCASRRPHQFGGVVVIAIGGDAGVASDDS